MISDDFRVCGFRWFFSVNSSCQLIDSCQEGNRRVVRILLQRKALQSGNHSKTGWSAGLSIVYWEKGGPKHVGTCWISGHLPRGWDRAGCATRSFWIFLRRGTSNPLDHRWSRWIPNSEAPMDEALWRSSRPGVGGRSHGIDGPFIDGLPFLKMGGFSMAMLNNQMVYVNYKAFHKYL